MTETEIKIKPMVGGQAVIEGVMIRSPEKISVAVRQKNGKILLKDENFLSITQKNRFFSLPFIRGGVILFESIYLGLKNLSWSSKVALIDEQNEKHSNKIEKISNLMTFFTVFIGIGLGIILFFYIPLIITDLTGLKSGFYYNVVDSFIRIVIFLSYILLISKWKEIQRIFQYHGAEHKSIFAYENGYKLTIENAQKFGTQHPRCGTSFIAMVILVSFFIFLLLGTPETISDKITRFLFIPIIGGLSYELIKITDKHKYKRLIKFTIIPGLWLQKITTKEPDEKQLKVGLIALRSSLGENVFNDPDIILYNNELI
jgi:uncharacterized protein YqhQ